MERKDRGWKDKVKSKVNCCRAAASYGVPLHFQGHKVIQAGGLFVLYNVHSTSRKLLKLPLQEHCSYHYPTIQIWMSYNVLIFLFWSSLTTVLGWGPRNPDVSVREKICSYTSESAPLPFVKFQCKLQFVNCVVEFTQDANTTLICCSVTFTLLIMFFQVTVGNTENTAAKGNNVRKIAWVFEGT